MSFIKSFSFTTGIVLAILAGARPAKGEETICARVELQIEQELTLEREGFEARLVINNGSPVDLTGFTVTLRFADADGNTVSATTTTTPGSLFFYSYLGAVGASSPPDVVAKESTVKIAYLIVPSPNSARKDVAGSLVEVPNGVMYYIGATIKYTQAGTPIEIDVSPDNITVRPMPDLELEYFLPNAVEAEAAFPLGVRVINHSTQATARKLKIQTAQPNITDNGQALVVDFKIHGAEVNGESAQPTLLANFGDIAPGHSAVGSWRMTSSLSGLFTAFTGEVSHATEFGGDLTSLIPTNAIHNYCLLGRVLVDFPGSDAIPDFVATGSLPNGSFAEVSTGNPAKVHESGNALSGTAAPNPPVITRVLGSMPTAGSGGYQLTSVALDLPLGSGDRFLYVRMPSPENADKIVVARRSDGKLLPAGNAWITKVKVAGAWTYYLNVFDCLTGPQSGLAYTFTLSNPVQENQAPVLQFSRSGVPVNGVVTVAKNKVLQVDVAATDDGPPSRLVLEHGFLPEGASFTPGTPTGTGTFAWTPSVDQVNPAVPYSIIFRAKDGLFTTTQVLSIKVLDSIAVGYNAWATQYWPGVPYDSIIGRNADPDGDDLTNLFEYALNGDPTVPSDSIVPEIGSTTYDSKTYLTLTYRHRTDDPTLVFEVVGSDTAYAPSWTLIARTIYTAGATADPWGDTPESSVAVPVVPAGVTVGTLSNGIRTVTIRDFRAINDTTPRRYLRLKITTVTTP